MNNLGVTKAFDQSAYDRADTKAKKAMIGWLKERDHCRIKSDETYSFDIISEVDEGLPRHLYEVEMKSQWWGGEWPPSWKEIRIPYRKSRLINRWKSECPDDLLTFVVFRGDCLKAWFIDGDTVMDSEVREVSNRRIKNGEKFFHINVGDAYEVDMTYESRS